MTKKLDIRNYKQRISETARDGFESAFELVEEIQEVLRQEWGIDDYPQPDTRPQHFSEGGLAERADTLSDTELAVFHASYVAYASFINARLGVIRATLEAAEAKKKELHSDLAMAHYQSGKPKGQVEDHIQQDGNYRNISLEVLKLSIMKKILEPQYEAYDAQSKTVSRLITLREQGYEAEKRDTNVKNRGRYKAGSLPGLPKGFRKQ